MITELPSLSRSDPAFKSKTDLFFGTQLPEFTSELNEEITRINAIGAGSYNATSTTSLTIGTGSKSLTVETGKGYALGQAVMLASTATPTNYMAGQVTSYNSGTGALVVNVTATGGSGTVAAWTVSVTALVAGGGVSPDSIVVLTSGTSWTCPAGVTKVKLRMVGGGGGAGRVNTAYPRPSGAAGGYAEHLLTTTPGTSYAYTIGAGGLGATSDGGTGASGGATTFNTGASTVMAYGGGGGAGSSNVLAVGGSFLNAHFGIKGASATDSGAAGVVFVGASSVLGAGGGGTYNSLAGYGGGGSGFATDYYSNGGQGAIILELYK